MCSRCSFETRVRVGRSQGGGDVVRVAALPDVAVRRAERAVEPLLLYPDPAPPGIAQALDLGGYPWKAVSSTQAAEAVEPDDGWSARCVRDDARTRPSHSAARCASTDVPLSPLLLVVAIDQLSHLDLRTPFDDFCVHPWGPRARGQVGAPVLRTGRAPAPSWSSTGRSARPRDLSGRYQRPTLDLTYMEYELLKFLVTHPGKVFPREHSCQGCGATSTTRGQGPSTSTSAVRANSARSTPISSRPSARSAPALARAAGPAAPEQQ